MGLDIDHGGAHARWSYSGFYRFRERLFAVLGGGTLGDMEGFGGHSGNGATPWPESDDPIVLLINHSDCDGDLSVEECQRIAPRLREIVEPWKDGDYDRRQALLLAQAMDNAAAAGEPLEFH